MKRCCSKMDWLSSVSNHIEFKVSCVVNVINIIPLYACGVGYGVEAHKFIDFLSLPHHTAFFYRICESDGMEIENIARHLVDLDEMNEDVELSYTFSLWSLIGNINTERFYMYRGLISISKSHSRVKS